MWIKNKDIAQGWFQHPSGGTRGHLQSQCWRHQDQERAGEGKLLWIWCEDFDLKKVQPSVYLILSFSSGWFWSENQGQWAIEEENFCHLVWLRNWPPEQWIKNSCWKFLSGSTCWRLSETEEETLVMNLLSCLNEGPFTRLWCFKWSCWKNKTTLWSSQPHYWRKNHTCMYLSSSQVLSCW